MLPTVRDEGPEPGDPDSVQPTVAGPQMMIDALGWPFPFPMQGLDQGDETRVELAGSRTWGIGTILGTGGISAPRR